jgi:hypothetical protein
MWKDRFTQTMIEANFKLEDDFSFVLNSNFLSGNSEKGFRNSKKSISMKLIILNKIMKIVSELSLLSFHHSTPVEILKL